MSKTPSSGRTGAWIRAVWPYALLAFLTLAMFENVLFAATPTVLSNLLLGDLYHQFIPWRMFGFGELSRGHLALWNPYLFSGAPFFGGFQSALLYPPNALYLFLPVDQAINWSIAPHVFLAGAFTYAWAARRKLHPAASLLSAVIFMFCGAHFLHIYAGHLSNLCTMVWAPLLFLAIDGLFEKPSLGWCLLGMFAVAMQVLAGHPQYVFYTAVAAAAYCVLTLFQAPDRSRFVLGLAVMAMGGVGLSAVQLFTGLQESGEMLRSTGVSYGFAGMFSFPPENFLTLLAPYAFGDGHAVIYWGRGYLWEASLFVGVGGLVLAIIGAMRGKPEVRRFSVVMIVLLLLLALGSYTPLFKLLFEWAPGFNKFRGSSKFVFLASLFLALLAGIGLNELLAGWRPARRLIGAIGLAGVVLVGAAACLHPSTSNPASVQRWHSIIASLQNRSDAFLSPESLASPAFVLNAARHATDSLLLGGISLLLVALLLAGMRRNRMAVWLLLGFTTLELYVFALHSLDSFDFGEVANPELKHYLELHPGDYRILNLGTPNDWYLNFGSLNASLSLRAQDLWGYDPGIISRYAQVLAATQGIDPAHASELAAREVPFAHDHPLFGMLRCRFLFTRENNQLTVYERTNYLPHLSLVPGYRVLTGSTEILSALTNANFNPRSEVILESEPSPPAEPASPPTGAARLVAATTDSLTIEAETKSPCLLLIADTYARGWRARALPGSSQSHYDLMPGDYCLRAIPLAAGTHRLVVEYRPSGFVIGAWISILSVNLFIFLVAVAGWRSAKGREKSDAAGDGDEKKTDSFDWMRYLRSRTFLSAALVAMTLAVFWPVVNYNFVTYDDPVYVTENPHVMQGLTWSSVKWAFTNFEAGFWHPLTWLSLMLDNQLFGGHAGGYHLTSLALHLASTVLLFLLLNRMTGALWRSAAVAALFALHPLHVEPVAWIASRKDVLSTFFGFLTLYYYARYVLASRDANPKLPAGHWLDSLLKPLTSGYYCLALLCFACGLMSKSMVVTLPVVMLLLDYWPLSRLKASTINHPLSTTLRLVVEKTSFFVLSFVAGLLTVHAEHDVGALSTVAQFPIKIRLLNGILSYGRYLLQMVWPFNLAVFYPFPKTYGVVWVALVALALLLITYAVLRGAARRPYLFTGWFWYVATLLPVCGFFQVGSHSHADRYTYLPLIGVFIIVVWGAVEVAARRRWSHTVLGFVGALLLMACSLRALNQVSYWQNGETLFKHAIAITKYYNQIAYNDLGAYLQEAGRTDEAIANYRQALEIDPHYADALNNLGYALAGKGDYAQAITNYLEVLRSTPDHVPALYNLGYAQLKLGQTDAAITNFLRVLEHKPDNVSARFFLATALVKSGRLDDAIEQYRRVLKLKPDYAEASSGLGHALLAQKQYTDAVECYQTLLQIEPGRATAHYNLGNALLQLGKPGDAVAQFRSAILSQTNYAEAQYQLGITLLGLKQTAEGVGHLREAVRLRPDWLEALNNLAWTLATCPDASLRNGADAVTLASRQADLTHHQDADALDTLAAAYAEAGQFTQATETAQAAEQLASARGDKELARQIEQRQTLYESGRAYHER